MTRVIHNSTRRRGAVLVMVIGVLAMLFIIGSTLLVVSRFERQTADLKSLAKQRGDATESLVDSLLKQFRLELVGLDGIPYNAGWYSPGIASAGDPGWYYSNPLAPSPEAGFTGEKHANFAGSAGFSLPQQWRGGNLLLGSAEPYVDDGGNWRWFAGSVDQLFGVPSFGFAIPPFVGNWGNPSQGPVGDGDGDGVADALPVSSPGFTKYLRIVPTQGMVLLDPLTHPSLLAQVIHPLDIAGVTTPLALQQFIAVLSLNPSEQEAGLHRRGELADNLDATQLANLPSNDMRRMLKYTLGYLYPTTAPSYVKDRTPHWQQVTSDRTDDDKWWKVKMGADPVTSGPLPFPPALTETNYSKDGDVYGRRHMITTDSSDNALRPLRDENRLRSYADGPGSGGSYLDADAITFYSLINPTNSVTPLPIVQLFQYGRVLAGSPGLPLGTPLQFNRPGLRTQFSLRDALASWAVDPSKPSIPPPNLPAFATDVGGNPVPTAQGSYWRLVQLTAYYLAIIQHTNTPDTNIPLNPDPATNSGGATGAAADQQTLNAQLQMAAQLAVNTIDFADTGVPVVPLPTQPPGLTDDPPTHFWWTSPTYKMSIDVLGVERQPYITEAYCRLVQKPKEKVPGTLDIDPVSGKPFWDGVADPLTSIYAVELYNPYDVPIDLSHYSINGAVDIKPSAGTGVVLLQPYSYIVVTNRFNPIGTGPWFASTAMPPVLDVNVFVNAALIFAQGAPVTLVRKDAIDVSSGGVTFQGSATFQNNAPLVVDRLAPAAINGANDTDPIATLAKASSWARLRMDPANNKYYDDPANPLKGTGACPVSDEFTDPPAPPYYDIRRPGEDLMNTGTYPVAAASDRLVRDYSLQRHKEIPGRPPLYWHATLSRQILFPFKLEYEYGPTTTPPCTAMVNDTDSAAVHQNLLLSGYDPMMLPVPGWTPGQSQLIVQQEFQGLAVPVTGNVSGPTIGVVAKNAIAGVPIALGRALPDTPHPAGLYYSNTWSFDFQHPVSSVQVVFDPAYGIPTTGLVVGVTTLDNSSKTGTTLTPPPPAPPAIQFGNPATDPPLITGIRVAYDYSNTTTASPGFRIQQILHAGSGQPVQLLTFPTTGSLLLVSRYANTPTRPASAAAAGLPPGASLLVQTALTGIPGALQRPDNGHMPLWDDEQVCTDNTDFSKITGTTTPPQWQMPQGTFDRPWGQLVSNYFTALPLEELYYYRNLVYMDSLSPPPPVSFAGFTNVRLVDLDPQRYNYAYGVLFQGIPVVEPVAGPNGPLVGPKVRGRININAAPWWVLDGLPLLSWTSVPSNEIIPVWRDPTLAPVPPSTVAISYDRFDGVRGDPAIADFYFQLPGLMMATEETADEDGLTSTTSTQAVLNNDYRWNNRRNPALFDLPTLSPALARAVVAYREKRNPLIGTNWRMFATLTTPSSLETPPGFLSVGQLADVLRRMQLRVNSSAGGPLTGPMVNYGVGASSVVGLREYVSGATTKPYTYLGYLQMVTPLVRLQDWATVKDHVFTIYMTQQDPNGGAWTHTEMTIDRTRCLYSNDLPAKVAETAPISYYNVVNDQKQ